MSDKLFIFSADVSLSNPFLGSPFLPLKIASDADQYSNIQLQAILSVESPGACPFYNAVHTEQLINDVTMKQGQAENSLTFDVPANQSDAQVVSDAGGFDELPPMLDMEDDGGLNPKALSKWVNNFCGRVFEKTGRYTLVYVARPFAFDRFNSSVSKHPLFAAEYGVSHLGDLRWWKDWKFWQHTSKGSVKGIKGHVDLDWFNGTVEQLKAFCGITHSQVNKPPKHFHPDAGPKTQGGNDVQVPELKQGSKGHANAVMAIQGAVKQYYPGGGFPIDGAFGQKTDKALRAFQHHQHVGVDGIVGPGTWSKILA